MSMADKTCLVTGGTAGIGAMTARELARLGAAVVVIGRNPQRGAATVESIRRTTGNQSVEFLQADLSSQADVRRAAHGFLQRHRRLDVLVNNAGAMFALRRESVDGIEMTLALNHLAYFLLTNLLLDTLKASAPARIINVSSDSHEMVSGFDFEDPQACGRARGGRRRYGQSEFASLMFALVAPRAHPGLVQYAQSKLANLLFTYELARRLVGTGVTVNALHPGFVASKFTAGNGTYGWFMRRFASVLAISAEEGARTPVHLATSPDVQSVSGQYFVKQFATRSSGASLDEAAARRLWKLSEDLTGLSAGARA